MQISLSLLFTLITFTTLSSGAPVSTELCSEELGTCSQDNDLYTDTGYISYAPTYDPFLANVEGQALLDSTQDNSNQAADSLSNSNQFDQIQLVDQTLYQPQFSSEQEPEIEEEDLSENEESSCSSCRRRRGSRRYRSRRHFSKY